MVRKVVLCLLLLASAAAMAESVEDVLKAKSGATEEQLDEAAAKMVIEDKAPTPLTAVKADTPAKSETTVTSKKEARDPSTSPQDDKKPLAEDEIPVLKNQKSAKSDATSNWFRLIGSALFVMTITGVLIFAVKKSAKKKNVGGKKAKIEMVHQFHLGPKKSVALIQVAGETILIGVTDHNINMIKPVALIDDELEGQVQDFNGFLEEEFTMEQLTAQKSRSRSV